MVSEVDRLRQEIVDSCRVLADTGCVREITGHVSVKIPGTEEMFVRCRRPDDPGVEFTTIEDVKRVGVDGRSDELVDGYKLQGEFPIHSEIYKARPDVGAVVHGHPRSSLLCGILGLPLEPIVGAYDPAAMQLGIEGVPVFSRAVLISTPELGRQLVETLGGASACLLKGHGIVTVGADVAEATVRAIKLETLAEVTVQCYATGRKPDVLSEADSEGVSRFVSQGDASRTHAHWIWNFYRRRLDTRRPN
jgi:ribulose-5-phosphate 4-epimerase/fuculose-1-phosphate aldolase